MTSKSDMVNPHHDFRTDGRISANRTASDSRVMRPGLLVCQGFPAETDHTSEARLSDPRVPGIASFGRRGTQTLPEPFQAVGDRQVGDEFHALVAELAGQPQAQRPDVAHGKLVAIHPIGEKSLWMACIG